MVLESLKVFSERAPSSEPICPPTPEGIEAVERWWKRWAACEENLSANVWMEDKAAVSKGKFCMYHTVAHWQTRVR